MKKKYFKSILITGIITYVISLVVIAVNARSQNERIYNEAKMKMKDSQYEEAVELLDKIPKYKDAYEIRNSLLKHLAFER